MPANCLGKPQHRAKIPLLFHNFLNFIAMKNKNRRWRTKFLLFGSNSVKTSSSKEKKIVSRCTIKTQRICKTQIPLIELLQNYMIK